LTSCCDTIVGGELIKGISGGERKRTSVGVELVTKVRTVVECILYASCAMLCGALPSS
jgi:hypothetical protein